MNTYEEKQGKSWTFLSNHAHVLVILVRNPEQVLRDVAASVGITERAVQRIVAELEHEGYVHRNKEGRKNNYTFNLDKPLRHPIDSHKTVGELLQTLQRPTYSGVATREDSLEGLTI